MRKVAFAFCYMPLLVAIDIASKAWAVLALDFGASSILIFPGISYRLAFNPGVSFGLFAESPVMVLALTSVLTAGLTIWFWKARSRWIELALATIIAGAVANIIDRVVNGAVTDFISFGQPDAPIFTNNLADMWITAGAVLLFANHTLSERAKSTLHKNERPPALEGPNVR